MELTAAASLQRNVKFWRDECGCSEQQIIDQVHRWFNFAYSPSEQEAAKLAFISATNTANELAEYMAGK